MRSTEEYANGDCPEKMQGKPARRLKEEALRECIKHSDAVIFNFMK